MLPPLLPTPAGWGTTAEDSSTCSLAPEGSYSPGGPMDSTFIVQCVDGTTNVGTGNSDIASCNICLAGTQAGCRGQEPTESSCLLRVSLAGDYLGACDGAALCSSAAHVPPSEDTLMPSKPGSVSPYSAVLVRTCCALANSV
jgi:hypothetical protein